MHQLTLIDVSGGRRTAEVIPCARLEIIEGMGHDYPPQLWGRCVDLVGAFVASNLKHRVIGARENPSPR